MSWDGWFEYDGTEIINVHRVETYARHHGWFKPVYGNDALGLVLGEDPYSTPLQDDPPWADPDYLDSYDFLGVYPLDVAGLESSSRTSTVTESTGDGGVPGRIRHATKQVVFNTLLLADSEAGAEYGVRWLRRALLGGVCGPSSPAACFGAQLCYLSSEPEVEASDVPAGAVAPEVEGGNADTEGALLLSGGDADTVTGDDPNLLGDAVLSGGDADFTGELLTRSRSLFEVTLDRGVDPVECLPDYLRSLRNVTVNNGPTVTAKRALADGGRAWMVTFTATAGNPFEFGAEREVIRGFGDPNVAVPWAGGVVPAGAGIDLDGYLAADDDCGTSVPAPFYDPLHPALILPPTRPSIPLGNFDPPVNWRRRQFTIPKQYIPLWGEMVPVVKVHARDAELRNLRVRFYADPFLVGDIADDPCAFCGDIIVSYVPQGYTLVLDGAEQVVYVIGPGGTQQRADSLVFASDGTPFAWPFLSCGFGYVVTLDLPEQAVSPVVDLSLLERAP